MAAIADVVAQLVQADCPVLFLDTCIILDVIRSIERGYKNCTAAASELLLRATGVPPSVRLVVSHLVLREWRTHASQLRLDAERDLKVLEERSGHFHDACLVFGITVGFNRAEYSRPALAERLHGLSEKVLLSAVIVDEEDECYRRAVRRVIDKIAPSKKGGEAKDCTILEEYLAVCRQLRTNGFQKRLLFCTSNTKDYCDKLPSSGLASTLATEFATINLDFCTSLEWAVHEASK
jgi:hypothetical protein